MLRAMRQELSQQILQTLERRQPPAAFVAELAAALRPTPPPMQIDQTIEELGASGRLLVVPHAPPDLHLEATDLRVIAPIPEPGGEIAAREAAEAHWSAWLRQFLANHHCE